MPQIVKEVVVKNAQGLHARPAAMFVQIASRHNSTVTIEKDDEKVNGKSIMGVMMLAAAYGSELTVIVNGDDAEAAIVGLKALINSKFDEE